MSRSQTAANNFSKLLDFDRLDAELQLMREPAPDLFRRIAADDGKKESGPANIRLESLLAAGAWAEAALLLVEIYLPAWQVRRLAYDSGEWCCSLVPRSSNLFPFETPSEATHRFLPLAILRAFVAVLYAGSSAARPTSSVPGIPQLTTQYFCCDNFA